MEGGQSATYLRLTRASSGLQVSVAKTYRDEMKINEGFYSGERERERELERGEGYRVERCFYIAL